MVCPMCISAMFMANAPVIGAALGLGGGVAVGSRMAFARPAACQATRRQGRRFGDDSKAAAFVPPPSKPPAVFYSSFPERDDE